MDCFTKLAAIAILDQDASLIAGKYIDARLGKSLSRRTKFEKDVATKLAKAKDAEKEVQVLLVDDFVVHAKVTSDVIICVVFDSNGNDLLVLSVVECISRCLVKITINKVTRRKLLESLDQVFLVIDEVVGGGDRGIILDVDSDSILSKIEMRAGKPQADEDGPAVTGSISRGSIGSGSLYQNMVSHARNLLSR